MVCKHIVMENMYWTTKVLVLLADFSITGIWTWLIVITWSNVLRSPLGFTGFDHLTDQVHIPVNFRTCCLFLKYYNRQNVKPDIMDWIARQNTIILRMDIHVCTCSKKKIVISKQGVIITQHMVLNPFKM